MQLRLMGWTGIRIEADDASSLRMSIKGDQFLVFERIANFNDEAFAGTKNSIEKKTHGR
jgi:hypothetical protein